MDGGIDWDQLVAEYRAGATFAQLGAKWGKSGRAIRDDLIRAGVELEDGRARLDRGRAAWVARRRAEVAERHARVRQLHEQDVPVEQIAQDLGYSIRYVHELTGARSTRWRDEYGGRDARVVEVYVAGRTVAETARITGVQPTQVGRIVKRAGVSRRPGPRQDQQPRPATEVQR